MLFIITPFLVSGMAIEFFFYLAFVPVASYFFKNF